MKTTIFSIDVDLFFLFVCFEKATKSVWDEDFSLSLFVFARGTSFFLRFVLEGRFYYIYICNRNAPFFCLFLAVCLTTICCIPFFFCVFINIHHHLFFLTGSRVDCFRYSFSLFFFLKSKKRTRSNMHSSVVHKVHKNKWGQWEIRGILIIVSLSNRWRCAKYTKTCIHTKTTPLRADSFDVTDDLSFILLFCQTSWFHRFYCFIVIIYDRSKFFFGCEGKRNWIDAASVESWLRRIPLRLRTVAFFFALLSSWTCPYEETSFLPFRSCHTFLLLLLSSVSE